jgi:hypothetical protein
MVPGILRRTLNLLLVVVITLIALELTLQGLYRMGFTSPLPYGMRDLSPDVPRSDQITFTPGFVGKDRRGITYEVNDMGFRDDPVDSGAAHIVFLGDSTTFGLNIRHEETYPEVVERLLRARGHNVQCVNTAAPGQATLDQRDLLVELLGCDRVSVVGLVLGFYCNDIAGNMSYSGLRSRPPREVLRWTLPLRRTRSWQTFRVFWTAIRDKKGRSPLARGELPPSLDANREYGPKRGLEVQRDWLTTEELQCNRSFGLTKQALDEIASVAAERGLTLFVLYLPEGDEEILSGTCPKYKELLRSHIEAKANVIWVDAGDAYREDGEPGDDAVLPPGYYSIRGDASHPGPDACRALGRKLADLIEPRLEV